MKKEIAPQELLTNLELLMFRAKKEMVNFGRGLSCNSIGSFHKMYHNNHRRLFLYGADDIVTLWTYDPILEESKRTGMGDAFLLGVSIISLLCCAFPEGFDNTSF